MQTTVQHVSLLITFTIIYAIMFVPSAAILLESFVLHVLRAALFAPVGLYVQVAKLQDPIQDT